MIVRGSGLEEEDFKSGKKKSTAIILCLFLGFLGVHRFYVGKIKSGGLLVLLALISGGTLGLIWVIYTAVQDNFIEKTHIDGGYFVFSPGALAGYP